MSDIKQLTPEEYDDAPWLHIYAQPAWHDPALILGTRSALVGLRDAIDKALADPNGEGSFTDAIAADGEGYVVEVRRYPRSAVQSSALPYTADYARDRK